MENPRHWRLKNQRYALIGEECPECKRKSLTGEQVCPDCGYGTFVKMREVTEADGTKKIEESKVRFFVQINGSSIEVEQSSVLIGRPMTR